MGIKKLHSKLANISQGIKVNELRGARVGVEASEWLYQALYSCSWELYTKQFTDRYVPLFEQYINLLLQNDVQPIVVFDGSPVKAKRDTQEQRAKRREEAKIRADEAVRIKDFDSAKRAARQAFHVTEEIEDNIRQLLHKLEVPYIKAPYEADAQLAYMAMAGVVDYIITEDADLLVYGAPKVIFKWDKGEGVGLLFQACDLWQIVEFNFTTDSFVTFCVLCGCDYLDNIPDVGISRAERYMHVTAMAGKDVIEELDNIGEVLNRNIELPVQYKESMRKAMHVFKHQIVYDCGLDQLCPCTPYPPDATDYGDYAGDIHRRDSVRTFMMDSVWMSIQDVDITRTSDTTWSPEEDGANISILSRGGYDIHTRQAGKFHCIENIYDVVEWNVTCLPVLTLPLALVEDNNGDKLAICLLEDEDLPTQGSFNLFCFSSCFILYEGEQQLLLWKWEVARETVSREPSVVSSPSSSSMQKSSEGEGDDVVDLVDDEDDDDDEADAGTHQLPFKVMGVTYEGRQDTILEARLQMSRGHNIQAILRPESGNDIDPNAIQIVFGIGDKMEVVGYIQRELTRFVHSALRQKEIVEVAIAHIKFRTFNPVGHYVKLLITKKGRWDNFFIRKSLSAK